MSIEEVREAVTGLEQRLVAEIQNFHDETKLVPEIFVRSLDDVTNSSDGHPRFIVRIKTGMRWWIGVRKWQPAAADKHRIR
jgi:hypothetical protein